MIQSDIVLLLDVDNTLLDNDAVRRDLHEHLGCEFGSEARDRYWILFEELRAQLGYADYLGALQGYRMEATTEPRLLLCRRMWSIIHSPIVCIRTRCSSSSTCATTVRGLFFPMVTSCFSRERCKDRAFGTR
jgi:hypothetical protein